MSLKSSALERKKHSTTPDSSNTANAVTLPAVVLNNPAPPVEDTSNPGQVTEGVSTGTGPSDGLWKLTLDKQPPAGVNLVLFVPVCPTQANGLPLPSAVPQTLPITAMQALPEGPLAVGAALGATLSAPLDLLTGVKQDPEAPLDLSKKSAVTYLPVKGEPEEFEISGQAVNAGRQEFGNLHSKVTARTTSIKTAPTGLIVDIKKEPQTSGCDLWSSESSQLTDYKLEKEIKIEVNISSAGKEK